MRRRRGASKIASCQAAGGQAALQKELPEALEPRPFDPKGRYKAGEIIAHPEHGRGKIENVLRGSLLVRFLEGLRPLNLAVAARRVTAILTVQNVDKAFGSRACSAGCRSPCTSATASASSGSTARASRRCSAHRRRRRSPTRGLITRQRDLTLEYVSQEPRLDPRAPSARRCAKGCARTPRRSPS